jgi:putative membrane protein
MRTLSRKLISAAAASLFALSGAAFAQATPDDAQIAAIVVAANTVDINAGKLAQRKAAAAEVKAFAKQMVSDHTGVNKQASALAKKLKLTPLESDLSKSLKQGGADNMAKLKPLTGKEFDKVYIDHEVEYHQTVIDAMDKTLIPSAQNAELKDMLVKTRPAFVAHLEHAKQIQASMTK